jgi:hypothetical protein
MLLFTLLSSNQPVYLNSCEIASIQPVARCPNSDGFKPCTRIFMSGTNEPFDVTEPAVAAVKAMKF